MKKYSFGIDLGTTNSCIAVMKGPDAEHMIPEVIRLSNGAYTIPSCVWFRPHGSGYKIEVGKNAYEHRYLVDEVVYSSKRDIGTDKIYSLNGEKLEVTPIDVAAEILKTLKSEAERMYGEDSVNEVTITVPAYFNHEKRLATKQAAELAGLTVISIINEPTAAALAYTLTHEEDEKFLIYDLGGGTFDVTIMSMTHTAANEFELFDTVGGNKIAQVIASDGDDHLGGDDLDLAVYEIACKKVNAQLNKGNKGKKALQFDIRNTIDDVEQEKLILAIEALKKKNTVESLSYTKRIKIGMEERDINILFSPSDFREALLPIYTRTREKIKNCMNAKAGTKFNKMILVGGSTKLQILRDMLEEDFPEVSIYAELNPDRAVAMGAAVQSSVLHGETDLVVSDVLPQTIGVDCTMMLNNTQIKGRFKKVILKDTIIPTEATVILTTIEDNQTQVSAAVYQGENTDSVNNTYLGTVVLEDVKLGKAGDDDIVLYMSIDANGLLSVTIKVNGKAQSAKLLNILKPQTSTVPPMLKRMINGLENTIEQYVKDDKLRQELLLELIACGEDPSRLPILKKQVQELTSDTTNQNREETTRMFADSSAKLGTSIDFADDDEDED